MNAKARLLEDKLLELRSRSAEMGFVHVAARLEAVLDVLRAEMETQLSGDDGQHGSPSD